MLGVFVSATAVDVRGQLQGEGVEMNDLVRPYSGFDHRPLRFVHDRVAVAKTTKLFEKD